MVHGQETCFRSVLDLEWCIRKLREALQLVEGFQFSVACAMSRCFPFPPPGYVKKPRPDDANLLIKEKSKEKKHKKEKDKEKKERKEKRKKDKSEEKRREKKEKKHKDKDKDKEKKKTSEKVIETSEHQNGGKPSPIGIQIQSTVSEPQFLLELEKRFRNDDGASESTMVEKTVAVDHASISLQSKFPERNIDVSLEAKEKRKDQLKDHKVVNGETPKVTARSLENGVVSSFMGEDRKQGEGGVFPVERTTEKPKEHKERKEKKKHKHRDEGEKLRDREERKQKKLKDKNGEKEKKKEKAMEEPIKESIPNMVGNGPSCLLRESDRGNGNLSKRKYPETNGIFRDSDSHSTKLPRLVSSFHPIMQNGNKCDHKVNATAPFTQSLQSFHGNGRKVDSENVVHDIMCEQKSTSINCKPKAQNSILTQPVRESSKVAINLTNLEPGVVNNHKVNKLQLVVEKRGNSDCSLPTTLEKKEPFCPPKMDNKKHGTNGFKKTQESRQIETQKGSPHLSPKYPSPILTVDNKVSSLQLVVEQGPFCSTQVDNKKQVVNGPMKIRESKKMKEKVETRERPPHPDLKYLSQILTIPQVEWADDFDDQEWLFTTGSDFKMKNLKTVSSKSEEIKQVWAEAIRVECADVVALPYVIPY